MELAERVAGLDPLGADEVCARLPELNGRGDTGAMVAALAGLVPAAAEVAAWSEEQCHAALRDLGMFLGSLKRHGVEPVPAVPRVEPVLLELGRRTDMVPRDTIHHLTEMNPTGARQRMYTGSPVETYALETVRGPLRRFRTAMGLADRLAGLEPVAPEFAVLLTELAEELRALESAMRLAFEQLEPTFFFEEMLPYIDKVEIGGEWYVGPSAAHVPLGVLDTLLWESDHGSAAVVDYRRPGLAFTLPRWRALHARWTKLPSLSTRVAEALARPASPAARASADALAGVLHVLVVFRARHVAFARKGIFDERIDLLRDILAQTRRMADLARS